MEIYSTDGLRILVGRNSRQNDKVTFESAARGDHRQHARDVPGGHVVVKCAGRDVPEPTVLEAAAVAAYFSAARADASVAVAATDVKHVRRIRGAGPGMVTFRHERTLTVAPRSPELLGLL
jgi:predicted ribosome quality control (RQC) complex YloA/Tae2 family protein